MSEKEFRELEEKIKSELEPYLKVIYEYSKSDFLRGEYVHFIKKYIHGVEIAKWLVKEEEGRKFTNPFTYLGLVESLGNSMVDMVVMLLVANGKDFHIERQQGTPRIIHAASIRNLEDEHAPLRSKVNFLKENGIIALASCVNIELRNCIAHLNFDMKKDGFYIRGKLANAMLKKSCDKLVYAVDCALERVQFKMEGIGMKKEDVKKVFDNE